MLEGVGWSKVTGAVVYLSCVGRRGVTEPGQWYRWADRNVFRPAFNCRPTIECSQPTVNITARLYYRAGAHCRCHSGLKPCHFSTIVSWLSLI